MFGRGGIVRGEKRFQGTAGFKTLPCQILQGRNCKRKVSRVPFFVVVILNVFGDMTWFNHYHSI